MDSGMSLADVLFQSTLPMRGETGHSGAGKVGGEFQSTLPMRGETIVCGL